VRHQHISDQPFVVLGYHLAGDRGAPVALMWGTDAQSPKSLVVPEPRNRTLRFEALAEFATDLCSYLDDPPDGDPQVVVPNPATANWLFDIVGRFTWNQPIEGEWAVDPVVPRAGKHLMHLGQEYRHPGSSTVLTAVGLLTQQYRTGQSADDDLNLGSALGWVLPEPGRSGRETAIQLEEGPPAGPVSDPSWDHNRLEPQVQAYGAAAASGDAEGARVATVVLRAHADSVLSVSWEHVWTVVDLMRSLRSGGRVHDRRLQDVRRFQSHLDRMRDGNARFSSRPNALAGAVRLSIAESAQADYEAGMLLDDPMLLAGKVAEGSAVAGRVRAVDRTNKDALTLPNGKHRRQLRPVLTIEPALDAYVTAGDKLRLASDPSIHVEVRSNTSGGAGVTGSTGLVELTVVRGANISAATARLPQAGDTVVFSDVGPPEGYQPPPVPDEVPWTHQLPEDDGASDGHREDDEGTRSAS
jgi:hypothetical protein